jgi:coproporphyrinogen III oxidase
MERQPARSPHAVAALEVVEHLQSHLVDALAAVGPAFTPVEWFRDEGRHGGGVRYVAMDTPVFDRASVNVSQVHYDDLPAKRLSSANALSTILHPKHPLAPSMHMHISLTEMRDGKRTWRLMADLNPSIPDDAHEQRFREALREAAGPHYAAGIAQGDRYFFIPALDRHRGVAHFYLEGFSTGVDAEDLAFAIRFGRTVTDAYVAILNDALFAVAPPTDEQLAAQLHYHSVYFLQVLTLDRGTTSGLLVHDQNDVGILGSIPSHVDRELLASWIPRLPEPQDQLLQGLLDVLPDQVPTPVRQEVKPALAAVSRRHYRAHPEALALQASGDVVPPTVANHE